MGEATLDIALRQATAPGLVSGVTVKVSSLDCPPQPLTPSPLTSHPPPVGMVLGMTVRLRVKEMCRLWPTLPLRFVRFVSLVFLFHLCPLSSLSFPSLN